MAGTRGRSYGLSMTQPLRDLDDVSSFKLSEQGRERLFELDDAVLSSGFDGWGRRGPND